MPFARLPGHEHHHGGGGTRLASDVRFILPRHDAEIFTRFPTPVSGIANIE
jgi:hypothetical protein